MKIPTLSRRKRWTALIVLLLAGLIIFLPDFIQQRVLHRGRGTASFYFSISNLQPVIGEDISLDLRVKSDQAAINAVEAHLHFNPQALRVLTMTTDKSFCSFYADNSFDNEAGAVDIACGTPNPGFEGDSLVFHLTLRPLNQGSTFLTLDKNSASILANDGKGTNLIGTVPTQELSIRQTY